MGPHLPQSANKGSCASHSRLLSLACVGAWLAIASARADVRAVAMLGDVAPGSSEVFGFLGAPVLNNLGKVAFSAELEDDDFTSGIWSEGDGVGDLRAVVLTGDLAPNSNGGLFAQVGVISPTPLFNGSDVAFVAQLDDGREGIFTDRERNLGQPLTKIALEGDPAPGGGNFQLGLNLRTMGGSHSGTAFSSRVLDTFTTAVLYSEGLNVVLSPLARGGDDAANTVSSLGGIAQFDRFGAPTINDTGRTAFRGETNTSTGNGAIGAAGIWTTSPAGMLRGVALQGQAAPGTSTTFSQFFGPLRSSSNPQINNEGDIAFIATLLQFEGNINAGIWVERDEVLTSVAVEMDSAPTTGSTFARIGIDPLLNNARDLAFLADLADGREGLWRQTAAGQLTPLVLTGAAAPGTSASFSNLQGIALNDAGALAFRAELDDFTSGIFTADAGGVIRKVVADNDLLATDIGTILVEQIEFAGYSGSFDIAGADGFNNAGQVAFSILGELLPLSGNGESVEGVFVFTPAINEPLPGDYNSDGTVNLADYTVWRDNLGAADETALGGNGNNTGGVDFLDYPWWKERFEAAAPAALSTGLVPEPGGLVMLCLSAIVALKTWLPRQAIPDAGRGSFRGSVGAG